jgi:hypothetical protein
MSRVKAFLSPYLQSFDTESVLLSSGITQATLKEAGALLTCWTAEFHQLIVHCISYHCSLDYCMREEPQADMVSELDLAMAANEIPSNPATLFYAPYGSFRDVD